MAVKIDTEGCAVVIGPTADGCEVGVVDVDDSELVALDSAVVEVALVVEAVLEDGLTSGTEVTGRIGTIGAKGLGTAVIAGETRIDVAGDVTVSVMEKAVTDAVPEALSLSVIGAGKKFEMQIVD